MLSLILLGALGLCAIVLMLVIIDRMDKEERHG